MNTVDSLSVRTVAALGRLADLQRRAEKAAGPTQVIKSSLNELAAALEELQVANEELRNQVNDLTATRNEINEARGRLSEFANVLPLACVWTDEHGAIREANEAAATLLNVARQRLVNKPLMLFVGDRTGLFEALAALRASEEAVATLTMVVRPRERRPCSARITARRLQFDPRSLWSIEPLTTELLED